jgi:hypothetical protein
MKWDGNQDGGAEWPCSWCREKDLDCHLLIMNWEMATARERGKRRADAKAIGVAEEQAVSAVVRAAGRVRPITQDILELVDNPAAGTVVQQICDLLGISMEEIALVWASPPCETYTRLDASNISRSNHHRDHDTEHKEARAVADCYTPEDFKKRQKALDHDRLTAGVTEGFVEDNRGGEKYPYAMENPHGMLARRQFMQLESWVRVASRKLVHYCNYGGQFHKPTDIWSSLANWVPGGRSGCGQCCQLCNVGRWQWVEKETRKTGMQYVHDKQIGGHTDKKGCGVGSQKQQRWKVPSELLEEIVACAKERGGERRRYVIDLFAGQGSMAEVARRNGYIYVPVDILNCVPRECEIRKE